MNRVQGISYKQLWPDIKKEVRRRREEQERKWAQEAIVPPQAPTTVSPRVQPEERPRAHVPADSHATHKAPASPSPPLSPAVPEAVASDEDWARDLASARRLILKLVNEIEGTMGSSEEKISKRINDLSFQRKIPRYIRTLMLVLVDYRNEVEYNDYMPTKVESVAIDGAWRTLTEWAVKRASEHLRKWVLGLPMSRPSRSEESKLYYIAQAITQEQTAPRGAVLSVNLEPRSLQPWLFVSSVQGSCIWRTARRSMGQVGATIRCQSPERGRTSRS